MLKTRRILAKLPIFLMAIFGSSAVAQNENNPFLTEFKLETRADVMSNFVTDSSTSDNNTALTGRYFNLHLGGNLTDRFSYYVRQRFIATDGSVKFFDNTDFLWLNFKLNSNWSFRAGKDALFVGGFEYDARPIDVMYSAYYWDNYYCFQLAASATWTSNDGRHKLMAQFGTSPFAFTGSPYGEQDLFSYNLMWMGQLGEHVNTLWSVNAFDNGNDLHVSGFLGNIALGTQLKYDKWDGYLDLICRSQEFMFAEVDYSVVSRINWNATDDLKVFFKGGYEYNSDDHPYISDMLNYDIMSVPNSTNCFYGLGVEYRPAICKDVRAHFFVADYNRDMHGPTGTSNIESLMVNLGLTWDINILKHIK